jgi:GTP cyclohydrolase II
MVTVPVSRPQSNSRVRASNADTPPKWRTSCSVDKLRAYRLRVHGADAVEANEANEARERAAVRAIDRTAIVVGQTTSNRRYLATKRTKLDHLLPPTAHPVG